MRFMLLQNYGDVEYYLTTKAARLASRPTERPS
jgi:hypothetical protein